MGLFDGVIVNNQENTEIEKDSLGGGNRLNSNIYLMEVKSAWFGAAESGSRFCHLELATAEGETYSENFYYTNKSGETFYTKDGNKFSLPSFLRLDTISMLLTEKPFVSIVTEEKIVKVYDKDQQKEIPLPRQVATEWIGKWVNVAVLKYITDKTSKVGNDYVPTGEFVEANSVEKFMHAETKQTLSEALKQEPATFYDKWLEKNKDQVPNKSKGTAGAPSKGGNNLFGANAGQEQKPQGKSLFG